MFGIVRLHSGLSVAATTAQPASTDPPNSPKTVSVRHPALLCRPPPCSLTRLLMRSPRFFALLPFRSQRVSFAILSKCPPRLSPNILHKDIDSIRGNLPSSLARSSLIPSPHDLFSPTQFPRYSSGPKVLRSLPS